MRFVHLIPGLAGLWLLPNVLWAEADPPPAFEPRETVLFSSAVPVAASSPIPAAVSSPVAVEVSTPALATLVHPLEGAKLPFLKEIFAFGAVTPGSTLTINGSTIPVSAKGGYLTMIPLVPGSVFLNVEARTTGGQTARLERRFTVAGPFMPSPLTPLTLENETISPSEDLLLAAGDTVRVAFQGSPQAQAHFAIEGVASSVPMVDPSGRGLYEGSYVLQPGQKAADADIVVTLKKRSAKHQAAKGTLTLLSSGIPKVGVITDDTVAARTAVDGGYDVFLYKGMRVVLTGKVGGQWRVRLTSTQSGWVKESAIQELPAGTGVPRGTIWNMSMTHDGDSTLLRIPVTEPLPYRVEQNLEPPSLVITLYGASNKTDLIRYDPADPVIRQVRWRQVSSDASQIIIEPKFKTWWGFDVRYEGNAMIVEVRKPWAGEGLRGMVIAVDAGHGGSDRGAQGPRGTWEKDANLQIARIVKELLEKAGAKPFLLRDADMEVPLYERPRIAWKNRARLFVSVHCNAAGYSENPLTANGNSVYWYQPQSQALAQAIHAGYRKAVPNLADRGLFYADFAVCRMTQMPSVLTEQAYIIVPEQEDLLFDPLFQKTLAGAIVNGIRGFVTKL